MITLHHLNNSRSQRILWLLEELGVPYEIAAYQRNPETRLAPDSLKAVHPLGKSPVITDGAATVAESGAIIDYLIRVYGKGRFMPAFGTPDYNTYQHWMHFAEGSAMLPFMLGLYAGRLGEAGAPLKPRIESEIANHLSYMEESLGNRDYFMGSEPSGPDFQLSFVAEIALTRGYLANYPRLTAYIARIHERPAYRRGLERGGPFDMSFVRPPTKA